LRDDIYYIGLDVHKRTISYCVKDAAGHVHQEGKIGSTRRELDAWVKTLPRARMMAMEATIFTGWICYWVENRVRQAGPPIGSTR
jgi:transposase